MVLVVNMTKRPEATKGNGIGEGQKDKRLYECTKLESSKKEFLYQVHVAVLFHFYYSTVL
jgi:hypothetical protein